jgi:hypothetical protein
VGTGWSGENWLGVVIVVIAESVEVFAEPAGLFAGSPTKSRPVLGSYKASYTL